MDLVIKVGGRDGKGSYIKAAEIEARSAITQQTDANQKKQKSTEIMIGRMDMERGEPGTQKLGLGNTVWYRMKPWEKEFFESPLSLRWIEATVI